MDCGLRRVLTFALICSLSTSFQQHENRQKRLPSPWGAPLLKKTALVYAEESAAPLVPNGDSVYETTARQLLKQQQERLYHNPKYDPAAIAIADSAEYQPDTIVDTDEIFKSSLYPFAAMLQGSAAYIASHAGETAVIHIPGRVLEDPASQNLLADISLARLLGMKIVIVVACCSEEDDEECSLHGYDCLKTNSLTVTDSNTLRRVEEEAGYLRTEIERKLNKCFSRVHLQQDGNVVSGNFYTARQFGTIRGKDYQHTGFTSSVNKDKIVSALANNDVVLLTTVGLSAQGELVNVNGYHLAAVVASELKAGKVVYMANQGSVLYRENDPSSPIQELPKSMAESITGYHQVRVHNTGFATFERAKQVLEPREVELLLHLSWAAWALDHGVKRAHIVNPTDGALLEELFTSKNGANTCLYHDDEDKQKDDDLATEDWDEFFASATAQPVFETS